MLATNNMLGFLSKWLILNKTLNIVLRSSCYTVIPVSVWLCWSLIVVLVSNLSGSSGWGFCWICYLIFTVAVSFLLRQIHVLTSYKKMHHIKVFYWTVLKCKGFITYISWTICWGTRVPPTDFVQFKLITVRKSSSLVMHALKRQSSTSLTFVVLKELTLLVLLVSAAASLLKCSFHVCS